MLIASSAQFGEDLSEACVTFSLCGLFLDFDFLPIRCFSPSVL